MKKISFKNKLGKKQKIIIGITVVALLGGGIYGFSTISHYIQEKKLEESVVEIYQIPGREKIYMNGKILPIKSEKIVINQEQGELSQIKVENNSYVEKGAPLFTCKNSSQIKEIESLKSQVSDKTEEKANAPDEETKLGIDKEIKQLNKQIAELNKTAYSTVYAPFSGNVYLNENSDEKAYVMILETAEFYVKGQINERDSYKIGLNQGVEITALATSDKYNGKIIEISDRPYEGEDLGQNMGSDSGMTKYEVKMSLDSQENLKNGLNAQIVALSGTTDKKVPNVSVLEESNKYYVFKVKNDIAYKTEIKVKEKKDDYYLVEDGINENDKIIKDIYGRDIKDRDKVYTGENMLN
ncbi:efflux RND transporter periplasmic adaptor subunit [Romboutsia sp.]|uniref:efflux RND transporter periplasmic adaptor subunit n=1 Tax=Romboutsia sp. TaxID=1965302 RepID=UPI003F400A3A